MNTALAQTPDSKSSRYDRLTVTFHWLTASLVLILFGSALVWNNVPRDWHWRQPLEAFHVSFGILFAVVLLARIAWRWLRGRQLAQAAAGLAGLLARIVHLVLYLLLATQAVLGFGLRWMQGESFSFFGLFSIPDPFTPSRSMAGVFQDLHNYTGWTIVILAGGHATAALVHHYVVKDGVLRRMVPSRA